MDGKHGRTTSGVECNHGLWAAHTVEQRRAWHAIIALGSTHGRTTSGVECHHRVEAAHTVEQRLAWHTIIALRQHKRSNNVRRGMTSPPLDCTQGRQRWAWHDITALGQHTRSITSGVVWHHRPWKEHTVSNVGRGKPSPPFGSTHDRQHRAWHDITALGQHTRSATSGVA